MDHTHNTNVVFNNFLY